MDVSEKNTDPSVIAWQRDNKLRFWSRVIRWSVAIPLMLFTYPWFGPFLILLGCVLIAPDIAGYFAKRVGDLLWPNRQIEKKPFYDIPESLVAKGKYAEAEAAYEAIIREFPREIKPHADLIDIAVRWMDDAELAEKLFQRGMSLLADPVDRERLTDAYERSRSRLKTHEAPKTISAEKLNEVKARLEQHRRELWR
ncbi:MAG: hypothetical protein HY343_13090 [Lentisphaerae bacterium]|nr:hypothetical protein [Lentisphaerota bacterium]